MIFIKDEWIYGEQSLLPKWVLDKLEEIKNVMANESKEKIIKTLEKHLPVPFEKPLQKKNLYKLLSDLLKSNKIKDDELMWWIWYLLNVGFLASTIFPSSMTADMIAPSEIKEKRNKLIEELNSGKISAIEFEHELNKLGKELLNYFYKKGIPVADMPLSGAKGSSKDLVKLLLGVGLALDHNNQVVAVIKNSYLDGLSMEEYDAHALESYATQYSKSVKTAEPGYIIKLINLLTEDIVLSNIKDCKSDKYLKLTIRNEELLKSLKGKQTKDGHIISEKDTNLIGKTVQIRSALYCQSKDGICPVCYNKQYVEDLGLQPGDNLGHLTATVFATPLTSLALKRAHIGMSLDMTETDFTMDLGIYNSSDLPIQIEKHKIVAKKPVRIEINYDEYKSNELIEKSTEFIIPAVTIIYGDQSIPINPGYPINVLKPKNTTLDKHTAILEYEHGDTIIETKYKSAETSLSQVNTIWNHRQKFLKSVTEVALALWRQLSQTVYTQWQHIEIMLLNTYIEYDESTKSWKRTQLLNQNYSNENAVDVITAIKKLHKGAGEAVGYVEKGAVENLGNKFHKKELPDYEKVIFNKFPDEEEF